MRSVPAEKVTTALGVYNLGIYLGAGIGFGLGGATVAEFGWRGIFKIFGGHAPMISHLAPPAPPILCSAGSWLVMLGAALSYAFVSACSDRAWDGGRGYPHCTGRKVGVSACSSRG